MKKGVRIFAWILALILLLQVAVMVVLQSPTVQTFTGKWVIGKLQDKMDADSGPSTPSSWRTSW